MSSTRTLTIQTFRLMLPCNTSGTYSKVRGLKGRGLAVPKGKLTSDSQSAKSGDSAQNPRQCIMKKRPASEGRSCDGRSNCNGESGAKEPQKDIGKSAREWH